MSVQDEPSEPRDPASAPDQEREARAGADAAPFRGSDGSPPAPVLRPWKRSRGLLVIAAGGLLLILYARFAFPSLAVEHPWLEVRGTSILPIPRLGEYGFAIAKGILALVALAVLGLEALRVWLDNPSRTRPTPRALVPLGRARSIGSPKFTRGALFVCAVLSAFAYFDFGDLGYSGFYHRWDIYHYYVGSKYAQELGYTKLYACAAVAQAETSRYEEQLVKNRKWRDLSTNTEESGETALLQKDECHARFSPERWEAFRGDIMFFKGTSDQRYWDDMQNDHGYNPPPLWTVIGGTIARIVPATDAWMKNIACLDLALFTATFAAMYWGFGGRVTAIGLIFWGTQFPANMFFTGGAFLRQDWLFFLILSSALARRKKPAWAGVSLAVSGLLRVFPLLFVGGWIFALGAHYLARREWYKPLVRSLAGFAIAIAVLVPVSAVVAGSRSYPEFVAHIRVHNDTPLTNHMGLKTLCSFSRGGRMMVARDNRLRNPFEKWKDRRRKTFHTLRFAYGIAALGSIVAVAYAARRRKNIWFLSSLGVLLVTSLTQLTCYYYSYFLAAIPLARIDKSYERGILAAAVVSSFLLPLKLSFYWDDRYEAQSLVFFAFATLLVIGLFPQEEKRTAKGDPKQTPPSPPSPLPPKAGENERVVAV